MRIRWTDAQDVLRHHDLPGVLGALSADAVATFPALRPHQRMPFHAFCVQLAALALRRAGRETPPADPAAWRDLLLELTPEHPDGEAWQLVTPDWGAPALLQPRVPEPVEVARHKLAARTPDGLDMLVTARNHDLKAARIEAAGDDDWLFALIALQTCAGLLGRGNYGVSRMNSGYGSRIFMGVRPPGGLGAAFLRDVREALVARPLILERDPDLRDDGDALLWLSPWDGGSRPFAGLDPFYIEICRRVRLMRGEDGNITAHVAGSQAPRIDAKARNGVTGDLWAPVLISDDRPRSWGIGEEGFGYRRIVTLLDAEKVRRPPLATPTTRDEELGLTLRFVAVRGGQGRTEGFHQRSIPIPAERVQAHGFGSRAQVLDRMAAAAKRRSELAGQAGRALGHALFTLQRRGFEVPDFTDESLKAKTAPWRKLFDAEVDAVFFDAGFEAEAADEPGDHRARWAETLAKIARAVFDRAAEAAPGTQARRIRAKAEGRAVLDRRLGQFTREARDAAA